MSRARRLLPEAENRVMGDINVTPMVDIMLVLLIVFIITAPVMH
ncbi:MAG: biopolymer transporter ExbD, partial [Sutterellaceae bacterium]|nr:biopolymer transporter ExbD [Sutterellaceae bacterium]